MFCPVTLIVLSNTMTLKLTEMTWSAKVPNPPQMTQVRSLTLAISIKSETLFRVLYLVLVTIWQ